MKFSSGLTIVAAALAVANTVEKRTTNNFEGKTGARLNLVSAGLGVDNGLYYKGIGRLFPSYPLLIMSFYMSCTDKISHRTYSNR